ncbi:hypothetical protein FGO68_gene1770 [Halteria grandinella]|uniref:Transmembrane protein n=1 Tax=Halteria grandinella TaxID=5974 RepID=A0A8J8NCG3_HALGN|nr:hypothetical protein FGO68_gene1770 [Halteria grandinella]
MSSKRQISSPWKWERGFFSRRVSIISRFEGLCLLRSASSQRCLFLILSSFSIIYFYSSFLVPFPTLLKPVLFSKMPAVPFVGQPPLFGP